MISAAYVTGHGTQSSGGHLLLRRITPLTRHNTFYFSLRRWLEFEFFALRHVQYTCNESSNSEYLEFCASFIICKLFRISRDWQSESLSLRH